MWAFLMCMAVAGCTSYPPADQVAACAAVRFGSKTGRFSVVQRSWSLVSGTEHAITYQMHNSSDRAVVTYNRTNGPVAAYQDISYGNHAEITGAIEAIEFCARLTGTSKPAG